jgi:hypothetical protein
MPRVPVVPSVQTGIRALPAVQRGGVAANPLGGLAQGIDRAGDVLFNIAMDEKRKANETRVLDADTTLTSASTTLLQDFFGKQGVNAIGGADTVLQTFDRQAEKVRAKLTPEQARMLQARVANQRQSLEASALRHERAEQQRVNIDTTVSSITTATQRGLVDPANTAALGQSLGAVQSGVDRLAELQGWSAETKAEKQAEAESALLGGAVRKLVDLEQMDAAQRLYASVQGKLVGREADAARDAVQQGNRKRQAQQTFDAMRAEYGDDTKKMRAKALALSGDARDDVLHYVDYLAGTQRQARAEAEDAQRRSEQRTAEAIRGKAARGETLSPSDVEFAGRKGLLDQVEALQLHRSTGHPPLSDPTVWARLQAMTPAEYAQQDENALRTVLSERAFSEFQQTKRKIQSGTKSVSLASVAGSPAQLTLRAARSVGLIEDDTAVDKLSDADQERYMLFQEAVDQLREQAAAQLGRNLTPTETRAVLDEAKRGVLTTDGGWLGRAKVAFASQLAPDDTGDWRVSLAAIAPAYRQRYEKLAQSLAIAGNAVGNRITGDMIERLAAMDARGLITPNMTPEQARALWQQVNR